VKDLNLIVLYVIALISYQINTQDIQQQQWTKRVLLILTDNLNYQDFHSQINVFQNQQKKLDDSNLVIYQITSRHYKLGLFEENKWIKRSQPYQEMKTDSTIFEVILIGLDVGEKLKQNTSLSTDKLFSPIDSMPMRRAETRHKNE
jgi:hypothetical protein